MTDNEFPYAYHAYGLNIVSQIEIFGFESGLFNTPEVYVKDGLVPDHLDKVINKNILYESNGHEILFRFNIAAYLIRNGIEIIVQRISDNVSDRDVSSHLSGMSFGALIHQRKMLPLHASTVIFKNKCLLIAGKSGSGKTTLAAALLKSGAKMVADDISVIDFSLDRPSVRPAFPSLKISADSMLHLGVSKDGLLPINTEGQKYYLPVKDFCFHNARIDHIFILQDHGLSDVATRKLVGTEKFSLLKKYTYLVSGFAGTDFEEKNFNLISKLAEAVPIDILTRHKTTFQTNSLIQVIEEIL